jgi:hypothetical protein
MQQSEHQLINSFFIVRNHGLFLEPFAGAVKVRGLATEWKEKQYNAGLQLRRAISIQPRRIRPLEKDAIAPSAARLC